MSNLYQNGWGVFYFGTIFPTASFFRWIISINLAITTPMKMRLILAFVLFDLILGYAIFHFHWLEPLNVSEYPHVAALPKALKNTDEKIILVSKGENFSERLQQALIEAKPGTVVLMPEGHFYFKDEISISKPFITLRGKGKGKTILDFEGQTAGKQGIFATNDGVTMEDFTVLNTDGNGIKVTGSNGVIIRRIEMKWTRGPNTENGGYSIYPVNTQNLLIEECETSGASDSGIYVGQSKNVIVRNNLAYGNVAGIEIENTQNADVYDNVSTENTAGILVFDLPNLNLRQGGNIRIFNNRIIKNNLRNYAPEGNIVASVAKGVGILVVATKKIEIFKNQILENDFSDVVIVNYLITGIKIEDEKVFDPTPNSIYVHDNEMNVDKPMQINFRNEINLVANWLFKTDLPHIIYDGIRDGFYNKTKFQGDDRICFRGNTSAGKSATFGNMHLDSGRKQLIFPGGPATQDLETHDCELPVLSQVILEPPVYDPKKYPDVILESSSMCQEAIAAQVNFKAALNADCLSLKSYNLFSDLNNPLEKPNSNGFKYELNSTLFSDYALKSRFIFLPPGKSIKYRKTEMLDFPIGTIISKTFWFENKTKDKKKVVETRILIHREVGWISLPYVWNENQTDAILMRGGKTFDLSTEWVDETSAKGQSTFSYHVPNTNQCLNCHISNQKMIPIGPKAKWLNRDGVDTWAGHNQLQKMLDLRLLFVDQNEDVFAERGENYNDLTLPLEKRARAYLDMNCAHCHSPAGNAGMSGLWLELEREAKSQHTGLCKHPVAAGTAAAKLKYDIVPGQPEKSILVRRMKSGRPANKMPEVGRNLVHAQGVQLVEDWIREMSGACD